MYIRYKEIKFKFTYEQMGYRELWDTLSPFMDKHKHHSYKGLNHAKLVLDIQCNDYLCI
jgi:hypothetical protein